MSTAGRKREFDKSEALEKAMRLFWEQGYASTSLSDLTDALGINKPSVYAAFGNKEQLFNAALDHYVNTYGTLPFKKLREPANLPFRQRLEHYFSAVIANNTDEALPDGCFVVKCHCEAGGNSLPKEVESALHTASNRHEHLLKELLFSEQRNGQLPSDQDIEALTHFIVSQVYGISVLARRGKSRAVLNTIAQTALKTIFEQPSH